MPSQTVHSATVAAVIEPCLPQILRLVQRMERHGVTVPNEFELKAAGRRARGAAALELAYALSARFGRAKGWMDFASPIPEEVGLQAIDARLEAYREPAITHADLAGCGASRIQEAHGRQAF